jgi:hypothetical protein
LAQRAFFFAAYWIAVYRGAASSVGQRGYEWTHNMLYHHNGINLEFFRVNGAAEEGSNLWRDAMQEEKLPKN